MRLRIGVVIFFLCVLSGTNAFAQSYDEFTFGVDKDPVPEQPIMSKVIYPSIAIDSNWQGVAVGLALIDTSGHVTRAKIEKSSGHALLDTAAKKGLFRATFSPATANGKPVRVWYRALIDFHITDSMRDQRKHHSHSQRDADPIPQGSLSRFVIYPEIAKQNSWEGKVIVRGLVDTTGRVVKVVVVKSSGHPSLDSAAVEALYREHFTPATADGKPAKVWFQMPVDFRLSEFRDNKL